MGFDEKYAASVWRKWRSDPRSVPADWANAFGLLTNLYGPEFFPLEPRESSKFPHPEERSDAATADYLMRFGHLHARLDPLGLAVPPVLPEPVATQVRSETYGGSLAVETGHLDDPAMAQWIVEAFEQVQATPAEPSPDVLFQLIETEVFDAFLASKYPTKKRFGSEGADAILPMLHALNAECTAQGIDEIVMGSMHRGRLSILNNFAGMRTDWLLGIFAGRHPFPDREDLPGDVPYHFGHTGSNKGVRLTLLPNPSHLETINPVAVGFARARRNEGSGSAIPLILHTDASVIGQGVNAELLQLSKLPGFDVGGTVHIVINNQIGFTTDPVEARSSRYCTGLWRAADSMILHVNGDDVDACVNAVRLAMRFRERFQRDAVIDLICYRANGHNEIDEPRFTQPRYYRAADAKMGVIEQYERQLISAGGIKAEQAAAHRLTVKEALEKAFLAKVLAPPPVDEASRNRVATLSWSESDLQDVVTALSQVPQGRGHTKMVKLMQRRLEEVETGITWALAEAMAAGCIVRSGVSLRFCGQDVERGPFSQRHLAAIHPDTGERHHALSGLVRHGATLEVVNSPLSEYAVLGFEFGYSLGSKGTQCIWEAQFGDFLNGAQIMVDQVITSGFEKWMLTSNLVILLPHGLEGQGPEHSSARIERMLQLCARNNIILAHPSTPANYFHLLHQQALQGDRPLFVITPKKLLRLAQARSPLSDFVDEAQFQPVLTTHLGQRRVKRAVICSGKIAYELEQVAEAEHQSVTGIRLERLYPFPEEELALALRASRVTEMLWLQEEPSNYGAGAWLAPRLLAIAEKLGIRLLPMISREESASPAGSFHGAHEADQEVLIKSALGVQTMAMMQG